MYIFIISSSRYNVWVVGQYKINQVKSNSNQYEKFLILNLIGKLNIFVS